MNARLILIIPVYNCEPQLPRVLHRLDAHLLALIGEVVVIDNLSTDRTVDVGIEAAKTLQTKVTILRNVSNFNLGGTLKIGFLYAMEHGYDFVLVLHGDDQATLTDFTGVLKKGEYLQEDLVIGARFHSQSKLSGYSWFRIFGNRVLNFICGLITKRKIDDLIAGLNCYRVDFLRDKVFLNFPDDLTFDVHLLLLGFVRGAGIRFVPISWREEDQISNAKVFRQTWIILKLFARFVVCRRQLFPSASDLAGKQAKYRSEMVYSK